MSERFVAGLVTAAVIAPVCAVCVLGPAVLASSVAAVAGWLGGFDQTALLGLVLIAGIATYGFVRRRGPRRSPILTRGKVSDER